MFTQKETGARFALTAVHLAFGLLVFAALATDLAAAANVESGSDEARLSTTLQYSKSVGDKTESGTQTTDTFQALITDGKRTTKAAQQSSGASALSASSAQTLDHEFWIYSADVDLFHDDDRDGFYHGIDLIFDADTIHSIADVYAVVYLSFEGGPWNEYVVTNNFTLFGTSGLDDYVIETELLSGYPTGYYDLLIELFDAWDGSYLAGFGPADSSELSFLPLEDANRDDPFVGGGVSISRGGGGTISWWMLATLLLFRVGRIRPGLAMQLLPISQRRKRRKSQ